MFDLGMQELILIFIVALLVFGPKSLPELGRTLGKGIREIKTALRGVQDSIGEEESGVLNEIKDMKTRIKDSFTEQILSGDSGKEAEKKTGTGAHENAGNGKDKEKSDSDEHG